MSGRGAAREPILIVSVSARMLAELAVRAGHEVVAYDRFCDMDLRALCPAHSAAGGMAELVEAALAADAPSVIHGAGLENRPDLVARLAQGRVLLGCRPDVIARVRDPAALGGSLLAAGLHYPRTYRTAPPFGGDDLRAPVRGGGRQPSASPGSSHFSRRYLRKPVRGGGGRGVREWDGGEVPDGVIVQELIDGLPCSAAAVADGRAAVLLGVTEQLIGRPQLGARGFAWCGNVTRSDAPLRRAAEAICTHLAADFGLVGLFGVDFVWDGERAWVLEVNPRPTGSLELFGPHVFDAHLAACSGELPAPGPPASRPAGKAILYATAPTEVPDTSGWPARGIRDVPHPGERIEAGHPICTLLAGGPTPEAVVAALDEHAAALRTELRVHAIA